MSPLELLVKPGSFNSIEEQNFAERSESSSSDLSRSQWTVAIPNTYLQRVKIITAGHVLAGSNQPSERNRHCQGRRTQINLP